MARNSNDPAEEREPAPDRTLAFLVHDVSRLFKRSFDRRARQIGLPLTRQQGVVVLYIARHEGISQAEVATWLGVEPIALVRIIDKLHEEGIVERRPHPTDRRVRTLWLSPGAGPVVEQILAINRAIRRDAFVGLPPGTREALIEALGQVKENLALSEDLAAAPPQPNAAD